MVTRTPKLNKALIDEICTYIENGMTNRDACDLCNINEVSFYRWLRQAEEVDDNGQPIPKYKWQRELKGALAKAQASFKAYHVKSIIKASRKNWTASAWLLERKFPAEYGTLDRLTVMNMQAQNDKDEDSDNLLEALRVSCNDVMAREGDEPEDV